LKILEWYIVLDGTGFRNLNHSHASHEQRVYLQQKKKQKNDMSPCDIICDGFNSISKRRSKQLLTVLLAKHTKKKTYSLVS